jgi:hypothetical protein
LEVDKLSRYLVTTKTDENAKTLQRRDNHLGIRMRAEDLNMDKEMM